MKFIVPIRAKKSIRSRTLTQRRHSSFGIQSKRKMDTGKRFLSVAVIGLMVAGLAVGTSGALFATTSAQSRLGSFLDRYLGNNQDREDRNNRNDRNDRDNDRNNRNNDREEREESGAGATQPTNPQPPVEAAPVEQQAPAAPVQQTPAIIPPAPVVPEVIEEAPVDTAPQIANMAAAQAAPESQVVTYTSSRISDTTRDQIIFGAIIAASLGGLLYTFSVIGKGTLPPRRTIPVRYVVPIQESIPVKEGINR